jgi:pimeloyl-ACP methyl ester carboxylesterase
MTASYPIPPRTSSILSYRPEGAIKLAVYDWGDETNFPLICVHGLTGTGRDFDFIAADLIQHGFRVIAIDMPGRGLSDQTTEDGYTYDYYLADLAALLTYAGATEPGSCDWLGVSMGGLLGMRIAGLPHSPIRRLVLDDIGCEVPQADLDAISAYLAYDHIYENRAVIKALMIQNNKGPFSNGDLADVHWEHRLDTRIRLLDGGKVGLLWDKRLAVKFGTEPIGSEDYWPLWANTPQPVLALRGGLSTLFPEHIAARMQAEKQGAPMDLVVIPDCGHVPPLLTQDQITVVRDWLLLPA